MRLAELLAGSGRGGAATTGDVAAAENFAGVVLVQQGAERVLWAAGPADLERGLANEPGTRFNTASLTKLFTAVAICRLEEEGKLDLARPLGHWLADRIDPTLRPLTSHQLLVHVGGLPEQVPEIPNLDPEDWLAPLAGLQLDFPPGTRWQYSNIGYALLGAVIETVTGSHYFDAVKTLVFEPAGMSSSGFEDTAVRAAGRAVGYDFGPDDAALPTQDTRAAGLGRGAPYGYATSTVADVERLLLAVDNRVIVSDPSASRILRGQQPTGEPRRFAGYGLFAEEQGDVAVTTSAGAGPGCSAWLDFVPGLGYRSVILSNYPKPTAHRVGKALRAALFAQPGGGGGAGS